MDKIKQFITTRNIFIIAGIIIFIEVIWSVWVLAKPQPKQKVEQKPFVRQIIAPKEEPNAAITLQSDNTIVKKGEKVIVNINIFSNIKVAGADVIVNYDPKLLSVISVKNNPVKTGQIFSDYPLNKVDAGKGMISVSGITDATGGVLAQGLFGSIEFSAKSPGVSKIGFDFIQGSTTDTNIINAANSKDVLSQVTGVEVNIQP